MYDFDLIIIGSGPAGHTASLLAAKNKLKVAIFEKNPEMLGGVCLNEGCIPLKGMIYYSHFEKGFNQIKTKVLEKVKMLRNGLKLRMENSGIKVINSYAFLKSGNEISADDKVYTAKNIIIASGSAPKRIFNQKNVFTSEKIFEIDHLPEKILIIGGGVVGCEYACFFNELGVNVTIVEILPTVLPGFDGEILNYFLRELKKKKINVLTSSKIVEIKEDNVVTIINENNKIEEKYDLIIETTGRKPNSENFKNVGIEIDKDGFIKVDNNYKTNFDNVYAIGDCINTPMLAYTASKEAEMVIDIILGKKVNQINYDEIPKVVFSLPQVGMVGNTKNEEDTKIIKYFFKANGKAFVEGKESGFIKLLVKDNKINGACVLGNDVVELLNELSVIINNKISIQDIKNTIHIHPSYNEIILDALNYG